MHACFTELLRVITEITNMKEVRTVTDTLQGHNKILAHKRKKGNTVSWRAVKSNLAELLSI